ncbi:MAG: GNAT family N-acetyltransferase, partial [Bergeyella zoohelcum]|nr:GNAT family N-acetyltransferase [Bergeyella zoohelcum]
MITITKVESTDNQRLVEFVLESRRLLFPMLNHSILPKDLANFNDFYIKSTADNAFFQAKNSDNQIVGAICMMGYDDRFPQFQFQENRVVEVARLFVKPEYRREKLGTKL